MIKSFDNFKFRCSALGNIVTASGKLTDGAKTHLLEVFIGEMYGVRKEIYGKALDKGIACEQDGFKMLNDTLYPERFIEKIKEPSENEYIKGTADCIPDDIVHDIKNAWDRFTFGKADLTHIYEWQLKGYMFLYDKPKARLFYCLNNMPDHLLANEERKMFYFKQEWATMDSPEYLKACEELRASHNYDSMPIQDKFKVWDIERSADDDEKIIKCVLQARAYLNELLEEYNERIENNIALMKQANSSLLMASLDSDANAVIVEEAKI